MIYFINKYKLKLLARYNKNVGKVLESTSAIIIIPVANAAITMVKINCSNKKTQSKVFIMSHLEAASTTIMIVQLIYYRVIIHKEHHSKPKLKTIKDKK